MPEPRFPLNDSDEPDGLEFDEEAERSWRVYLGDFKREVWPVFQEHGFTSMECAFQCWLLNRVNNDIGKLLGKFDAD